MWVNVSLQPLVHLYLRSGSVGSVTEILSLHSCILASYAYDDGSFSPSSTTQLVTPLNETRLQHSFQRVLQIFQRSERFGVS